MSQACLTTCNVYVSIAHWFTLQHSNVNHRNEDKCMEEILLHAVWCYSAMCFTELILTVQYLAIANQKCTIIIQFEVNAVCKMVSID